MENSFMRGVKESESWNKRQQQRKKSWIENVKRVLGYSQELAEKEYKRIFETEYE